MQLTLNLEFVPASPLKPTIQNHLWIDVSPEARMIGFTQKVEVSQSLSDVLQLCEPKLRMPTTNGFTTPFGWLITTGVWIDAPAFPSRSTSSVKMG